MENELEDKTPFNLTLESVRDLVVGWNKERKTEALSYSNKSEYNQPIEYEGYTFGHQESYGGEGCGDEYWCVFYAEKDGAKRYFYVPGYYSSGNGGERDWYDLSEVEPYEKTVTDWKQVK